MIRFTLLLLALPVCAIRAQEAPIHLLIDSKGGSFRIVRSARDSTDRPIFGRGRLELSADSVVARSPGALEVASLDTLGMVHVDATQNGHVIASGEGSYLTIRREDRGISIDVRSAPPTTTGRGLRKP